MKFSVVWRGQEEAVVFKQISALRKEIDSADGCTGFDVAVDSDDGENIITMSAVTYWQLNNERHPTVKQLLEC